MPIDCYELTIHLRTCTYFQALYVCMDFSFSGYLKIDLCVPKSKKQPWSKAKCLSIEKIQHRVHRRSGFLALSFLSFFSFYLADRDLA